MSFTLSRGREGLSMVSEAEGLAFFGGFGLCKWKEFVFCSDYICTWIIFCSVHAQGSSVFFFNSTSNCILIVLN